MADDIVTRLRQTARACNHGWPNGAPDFFPDPTDCARCLRLNAAADEIERLRQELRTTNGMLEAANYEVARLAIDLRDCRRGVTRG